MSDPAARTCVEDRRTCLAFTRMAAGVELLSSAIAGFALLAGARAFMFVALLGWREPVLGGAGLLLLAVIGWLRSRCDAGVVTRTARKRATLLATIDRRAADA
ncbi:hypothetical protein [Paraburkholderia sejongensis]